MLALVPEVLTLIWRQQHPVPLGRSGPEVARSLATLLPAGITVDSAVAVVTRAGLDYRVATPGQGLQPGAPYDDAGGPTLVAMARDIDADLFTTRSAEIVLAFDARGRLARRHVTELSTGL
ncbi:hypothetical protein [Roseisolibacter agri]|uniref:hypothetical protein n=1 Tax=Roseisolibacter agri TaxID=2014610 RepID=UPI0024E14D41|nr:hypothetical protein [Roseisolibacter agri]